MDTVTFAVMAEDGTEVLLAVPTVLPSAERAEHLRGLYDRYVTHPTKHWKGPAMALVPADIADDVAEAMDFMGSIVDERTTTPSGRTRLYSTGYWAHGF